MTDYALVMTTKFPDAEYAVAEDGTFVAWNEPGEPPTVEEMDGWWPEVQALAANAQATKDRLHAYEAESDPLYMEWQAGEGTKEAWLAKRQEIKDRYPFVPVP